MSYLSSIIIRFNFCIGFSCFPFHLLYFDSSKQPVCFACWATRHFVGTVVASDIHYQSDPEKMEMENNEDVSCYDVKSCPEVVFTQS